ncbi:hypothetical protein C5167_033916, partial [Papaver somniferum]
MVLLNTNLAEDVIVQESQTMHATQESVVSNGVPTQAPLYQPWGLYPIPHSNFARPPMNPNAVTQGSSFSYLSVVLNPWMYGGQFVDIYVSTRAWFFLFDQYGNAITCEISFRHISRQRCRIVTEYTMKKVEFSASNEIPADLLLQIFYNSPVKSLIRFSCVSKLWFHLTINDHQQFNKFHFVESQKKPILIFTFRVAYDIKKFYYLEKEEHDNALKLLPYQKKEIQNKYVIGNVNGLFCYWNLGSRPMCEWVYFSLEVCNPSRVKKLTIVSRLKSRVGQIVYGFRFGYDHLKDEYKVIGILKFKEEYEYYVLTLGGIEHWRQIHNPRPKHRPTKYFESTGRRVVPPISCGGTIFYEIEKDECFTLVSLDLHSEKFQMIKLPCDGDFSNLYPSEYKGCFCYSSVQKINPHKGKVALYMLKDIVTEDWVKEIIEFDLPRELDYPAPPSSTRIMNFPNQVFLY